MRQNWRSGVQGVVFATLINFRARAQNDDLAPPVNNKLITRFPLKPGLWQDREQIGLVKFGENRLLQNRFNKSSPIAGTDR